ncbi:MAG: S1/P1 nuclease [Coxiellaceae bacterium]|nr:S1/P1 nuclease [Coxiellaceae bacterium]
MRYLIVIFFPLTFIVTNAFAWGNVGHRLVAQIAYDELTPQAKAKIDNLTAVYFHSPYPEARFLRAATWPDTIRKKAPGYNAWHYSDAPFVKDNIRPPMQNSENVAWAIVRAEHIISDPKSTQAERATNLSFLIHFVGDIHQPLHCVSLYSNQFPEGDRGGNLYRIQSVSVDNLHGYWDQGLGLLYSAPHAPYLFRYQQIQVLAKQWMARYPRAFFGPRLTEKSTNSWAKEGYNLSTTFAYTIPQNAAPNDRYVQEGQAIVRAQIVLAGYRLADILNVIFSGS